MAPGSGRSAGCGCATLGARSAGRVKGPELKNAFGEVREMMKTGRRWVERRGNVAVPTLFHAVLNVFYTCFHRFMHDVSTELR